MESTCMKTWEVGTKREQQQKVALTNYVEWEPRLTSLNYYHWVHWFTISIYHAAMVQTLRFGVIKIFMEKKFWMRNIKKRKDEKKEEECENKKVNVDWHTFFSNSEICIPMRMMIDTGKFPTNAFLKVHKRRIETDRECALNAHTIIPMLCCGRSWLDSLESAILTWMRKQYDRQRWKSAVGMFATRILTHTHKQIHALQSSLYLFFSRSCETSKCWTHQPLLRLFVC